MDHYLWPIACSAAESTGTGCGQDIHQGHFFLRCISLHHWHKLKKIVQETCASDLLCCASFFSRTNFLHRIELSSIARSSVQEIAWNRINFWQTGWDSIYLPRKDGRLSWHRWLVTYRVTEMDHGLPADRRSPIQVLTRHRTAGESNSITSPTPP